MNQNPSTSFRTRSVSFLIILIIIGVAAVFGVCWYCRDTIKFLSQPIPPMPISQNEAAYRKIKLYYYNEKKDKEAANYVPCLRESVLPVEREIPLSKTPIRDTMELLLKGQITDKEKQEGFSPVSNRLKLTDVNLKENGNLILEFEVLSGYSMGGSCLNGLIGAEIIKTAQQFFEVKTIEILPYYLLQP